MARDTPGTRGGAGRFTAIAARTAVADSGETPRIPGRAPRSTTVVAVRSRPGYHEASVTIFVGLAIAALGWLWILDFVVDDPLPDHSPVFLPAMDPIVWMSLLFIVAVLVWFIYVASAIVDRRAG